MEHHRGGRPRHPDILTPAEWRVLEEVRRGGTNAEIATRLGIGAETVKSHISSMLAKLDLQDRKELAAWRPDDRRGWLRAAFAAPAALTYVARPLVWVGVGTAAIAGVTVAVVAAVVALAVVLVVVPGGGDPAAVAPPPVTTPEAITVLRPMATATPLRVTSPSPTTTLSPTPIATQPPTPTPDPGGLVMHYDRFDPAGEASTPGSYAFLMPDADSAEEGVTAVVTTYEQLREESSVLRVNVTDAGGTSQRATLRQIVPGDIIEWHKADDCFVRYTVGDITAGASTRDFAVEWMTYAFTGCSGAVAIGSAPVSVGAGPLPNLGGMGITAPVVHGVYQIVPVGWTGATKASVPSDRSTSYPPEVGTTDITVARTMRYWRDPAVPSGWVFYGASGGGDELQPVDGYCASWVTETGAPGFEVCGKKGHRIWFGVGEGSWHSGASRLETRVVAGRPASVIYSVGDAYFPLAIRVYDPATDVEYTIWGEHRSVLGWHVDALIAIAEGMFATE